MLETADPCVLDLADDVGPRLVFLESFVVLDSAEPSDAVCGELESAREEAAGCRDEGLPAGEDHGVGGDGGVVVEADGVGLDDCGGVVRADAWDDEGLGEGDSCACVVN